jgi:hypothetical protein
MKKLKRETLAGLTEQMAAHAWRDREIDELVDPKLGIITGFQALLEQLDELRRADLGFTAPAQGVQRRDHEE